MDPSRTDDDAVRRCRENATLSFQLGCAIDADRADDSVGSVRRVRAAVEYIIRRQVNETDARTLRGVGDYARRDAVGLHRFVGTALGAVDVGEGRAVDDELRLRVGDGAIHG